ncbi:Threonyl/alanyl tRNA synthetase SAD [Trinorchestia longiramus]|nr:Threonyl/alanyl tRNA synthetase SAD [Trinorchestia longiramus]
MQLIKFVKVINSSLISTELSFGAFGSRTGCSCLTRNYSSAPPFTPPMRTLVNSDVTAQRLQLFEQEKERQRRLITDVHKITVQYRDQPEQCTLIMNKNLSTPYDCARHVSMLVGERAVLAEVDGQVWDMHRPLEADVEQLKFLHFKEADPFYANRAFWRSCSVMLGAVLESSFKSKYYVQLCSFPAPNVRTGSFVYDVDLGIDWTPKKDELRMLSAQMVRLSMQKLPFERLSVPVQVALRLFAHNEYKRAQIPLIAESEQSDMVSVYRVGNFLDMSCGPLIANTGQLGRVTITAVHRISSEGGRALYRVQGVALPHSILMNHFSYGILEQRARKMNEGRLPDLAALGLS